MAPDQLTPLAWLLLAASLVIALVAVLWSDHEPPVDEPPNLDTRGPDDR